MANNRKSTLEMEVQARMIQDLFPDSAPAYDQTELTWKYIFTPSPVSSSYWIKLYYKMGDDPNIYVTSPKLALYPGKTTLPHSYNTEKQWLCLYYKPEREWNADMAISETVIPWISEWLFHYECWLATGEWHGGGIH